MDPKGKDIALSSEEDGDEEFDADDFGYGMDDDGVADNLKNSSESLMPCPTELDNLSEEAVKKMVFDTLEDAKAFYQRYSRQVGFGIRNRDMRKGKSDEITMRRWVCVKEGQRKEHWLNLENRKRRAKALTRENCPAEFRVKFDPPSKLWTVTNFVSTHSHQLVKPEHIKFVKSHKQMTESDKAQFEALRTAGVKSSQIYDILASQRGGYQNLYFTPKDLHNWRSKRRNKEKLDGDAQKSLGYFAAKKADDPAFYFDYKLNDDNELGSLFWADSTSRADYACFGDLLAFDATYKRNVYDKPLVTLIGVNHHHQTIVFGCALLERETTIWYTWLLHTFLKCMGDKQPFTVVTDGDLAMRAAIRSVFPEAIHRLCIWHLEINASNQSNEEKFLNDFKRCAFDRMSIEEFNNTWCQFVNNHNLQNSVWANKMFVDRGMWAEAYLKDKFFAGIRTTSRCEGLHNFMNRYLNRTLMLFEFIVQFETMVSKIRATETELEHDTFYSTPVCSYTMKNIELHAAEVYTAASFKIFQDELINENNYIIAESPRVEGDVVTYKLYRYLHPKRQRTIVVNKQQKTYKCQCMLLQSYGFPCRHSLNVMKQENLKSIPESCIVKRWTKSAKSIVSETIRSHGSADEVVRMVRYGALSALCNKMSYLAAFSQEGYNRLSQEIMRITKDLDLLNDGIFSQNPIEAFNNIRDPQIQRNRRIPNGNNVINKAPKKCGVCKQVGHNRTKCPNVSITFSESQPRHFSSHAS